MCTCASRSHFCAHSTGTGCIAQYCISTRKEAWRVCVLYIVFIQLYIAPVKKGLHQPSERTHGVQAVVLLIELNRQLLKYYWIFKQVNIPIFKSQMGSMHGGPETFYNYTINYLIITSYLPNNHKKVNCCILGMYCDDSVHTHTHKHTHKHTLPLRLLPRWSKIQWIRSLVQHGMWWLEWGLGLKSLMKSRTFCTCSLEETWPSVSGSVHKWTTCSLTVCTVLYSIGYHLALHHFDTILTLFLNSPTC